MTPIIAIRLRVIILFRLHTLFPGNCAIIMEVPFYPIVKVSQLTCLVHYSAKSPRIMTTFQVISFFLAITLLILVVARFRRSGFVLIGGLFMIGLYTLASLVFHKVTLEQLGLKTPKSWLWTFALAIPWLGLMFAYSPVADRLATHWFRKPPSLEAFCAIQQSRGRLIAGIAALCRLHAGARCPQVRTGRLEG